LAKEALEAGEAAPRALLAITKASVTCINLQIHAGITPQVTHYMWGLHISLLRILESSVYVHAGCGVFRQRRTPQHQRLPMETSMTFLTPGLGHPTQVPQSVPPAVNWHGRQRVYEFQLHPIGVTYFERSGVYILCKPAATAGHWDACYVGETDNFWRRLTSQLTAHHRWQSIRAAGATHICTLHVPGDDALRLAIETDLRQSLNPPCNRQ
jgi:hypothetical protein